ncbi:hypothetical protein [Tengunoibacter tsumagoiensis]|uniref:Uncharacterized protein n=1 Tax=Tengunoibacter tsumagoiensis TaxID=2014871 RepID=A0A402A9G2_9CHLR|nr:hypothetical protein [Tengunoibacter tsumagoiensis]GCE15783.1 hypothetical protein KTT_56420 [Tengunoibacter tsumagoiensis]
MNRLLSSFLPGNGQGQTPKTLYFALLVAACVISALLIFAFWVDGWSIWILGLLIIVAWLPLIFSVMSTIYQQHPWLSLLYLVVVGQAAHMIEHLTQAFEIHVLGYAGPKANGIIGFLNIEWVHLVWNSWVLLLVGILLIGYRKNGWLWFLFAFAIYHELEHIYMVYMYMKTGHPGNPGFLAHGGLFAGGLPITRPDLHAIYAVLEEAMLLMIYVMEQRKVKKAAQFQLATA